MHFYSKIWIINLYSPVKYWLDEDLPTTLIPVNDVDDYFRMSGTGITKLSGNVTKYWVGDWTVSGGYIDVSDGFLGKFETLVTSFEMLMTDFGWWRVVIDDRLLLLNSH